MQLYEAYAPALLQDKLAQLPVLPQRPSGVRLRGMHFASPRHVTSLQVRDHVWGNACAYTAGQSTILAAALHELAGQP